MSLHFQKLREYCFVSLMQAVIPFGSLNIRQSETRMRRFDQSSEHLDIFIQESAPEAD